MTWSEAMFRSSASEADLLPTALLSRCAAASDCRLLRLI